MSIGARVLAVDLARGLALIGMMLAHLGPVQIGETPPVNEIITSGRAAPLFALLAGVSLSLVHRRDRDGVGSVVATCIRGLLLVAAGLTLGTLRDMPVLVIFAVYGLLIVAALPLRTLATRTLMLLTIAWAVLAPVGLLALRIHHEPVLVDQPAWTEITDPRYLLGQTLFWGGYPAVVWMTYVMVGLLIGRLDLTDHVIAARVTYAGLGAMIVPLAIAWLYVRDWRSLFAHDTYPYEPVTWSALWLVGPHTSMPLNVISAAGSAAVVLGLCAFAVRSDLVRLASTPVRAAGAMTMTLYTAHVLWTWRQRLDVVGPVEGSWGNWFGQVLVLVAAAAWWHTLVGRGPLEQIVRWVSLAPRSARTWLRRQKTPVPRR